MEKTATQSHQTIGRASGSGGIRPPASRALGPDAGAGRGLLPASSRRAQTSRLRARKPVTETQRSQSMFRAPGRAHLAQLQRADSEECLARGEPRGPLWRSGMSSAA